MKTFFILIMVIFLFHFQSYGQNLVIQELVSCGFTYSLTSEIENGCTVFIITKSDDGGNAIWIAKCPNPNNNSDLSANLQPDPNCGVYLTVTADNCLKQAYYNPNGVMQWAYIADPNSELTEPNSKNAFNYHEGWPLTFVTNNNIISQSINTDRVDELSVSKQLFVPKMLSGGTVYGWQHNAVSVSGWPVTFNNQPVLRGCSIDGNLPGNITVGQSDISNSPGIHNLNKFGVDNPCWPLNGFVTRSPIWIDVDGNGELEVLLLSDQSASVYLFDPATCTFSPVYSGFVYTGMASGDMDNDISPEIVLYSYQYSPRGLRYKTIDNSYVEWNIGGQPMAISNGPTIADLDNDNNLEILIPRYNDLQVYHSSAGFPIYWSQNNLSPNISEASVGDLDGNGYLEVVCCATHDIYVYNYNGAIRPGWPQHLDDVWFTYWPMIEISSPIIGDIDGDLKQEIIAQGRNNAGNWVIYAFKDDGTIANGFPIVEATGFYIEGTPLISNIAGDNRTVLVAYGQNYITTRVVAYDISSSYNPSYMDWPMRGGNPQRTFCYKRTGGLTKPRNHAGVVELHDNYPNPFNPKTEIRYTVPYDGSVKLSVYNVLGEEIAVLVNEYKSAGNYSVNFLGTNLSSGLYFYRIEAGSFIQTKKMLLVK